MGLTCRFLLKRTALHFKQAASIQYELISQTVFKSKMIPRPAFSSGAVAASLLFSLFVILTEQCQAFTFVSRPAATATASAAGGITKLYSGFDRSIVDPNLFEGEEEEMLPICRNFVAAKYERSAREHGREQCNEQDVAELLRSLLPPVTPSELDKEVKKTLALILKNPKNTKDCINEESFVEAIVANSYWREAGGLVVKE
jgi:hypothetical protein